MTSDPIQILLRHFRWGTARLLDRCAQLSEAQFHQRFDIGPGSLHDTLEHIIGAVERWTRRIRGQPVERVPGPYTVEQLRDRLNAAAAGIAELAEELQQVGALDQWRTSSFAAPQGGTREMSFPAGGALVHALVHASYHFAQANNMLRRLGVFQDSLELDVMDWIQDAEAGR